MCIRDRCGAALAGARTGIRGGTIFVSGSAGDDCGSRMRRGLIVVSGTVGQRLGADMKAGTIFVDGSIDRLQASSLGRGMIRGTIICRELKQTPAHFLYACRQRLVVQELIDRQLDNVLTNRPAPVEYRIYSGDISEGGRGELLVMKDQGSQTKSTHFV